MASASGSDDSGSPAQRSTTTRRKKSTTQLSQLEKLYSENKYPSEEARAKLSEEVGLSEKQMQIWFTHRRHKDRKDGVADARLTFYSMRHKGGEAHLDFMEELSNGKQGMAGNSIGKDDKSPDRGHPPVRPHSGGFAVQNTQHSSGRSTDSDSDNSGHGQVKDLLRPTSLKASLKRPSSAIHPHKAAHHKKPTMPLPPRPKAQAAKDIERAAIATVEAQLGEAVRADGPHVGLVFDSIPQGAWARLTNLEGQMVPTTIPAPAPAPVPVPVYEEHPVMFQGTLVSGMQGRFSSDILGRLPSGMHGRLPSNMQGRLPLGMQGRLPSDTQGRVPLGLQGRFPSDTQGRVPLGLQGRFPSDTQGRVPLGMQGRLPSDTQGRVPLDMQGRVPLDMQGRVFSDMQGRVPSDMQRRVPSDVQGRFPSDTQGRFPSDTQGRFSSDMQGRFPSDMQGRFPSDMQRRFPSDMQGRLPSGIEGRLPMGMQERSPLGMQAKLALGMQERIGRTPTVGAY